MFLARLHEHLRGDWRSGCDHEGGVRVPQIVEVEVIR
jgi:hypothetical protein